MKALLKTLLVIAVVLPRAAVAEVITCPERFPSAEIRLPEGQTGRQGTARLLSARLSGAYMVSGDLYAEQEFIPDIKKVPGGHDITYSFPGNGRWLVCEYGGSARLAGSVQWWDKLNPRFTECELKLRETRLQHAESKWSATANCK